MDTNLLIRRVVAKYKAKKKLDSGNTVYMYSERQIALRNGEKAKRIANLEKVIKDLRQKVKKDLKSSDPKTFLTSLAVGLIDHTFERVGNEGSADDGHFGVTGWQRKHVNFGRGGATIRYVGKSGVKQEKKVSDAALVKALRDAYEGADEADVANLFEYNDGRVTASEVNEYLKPFKITAKDIRGFHANKGMLDRLKEVRKENGKLPTDKKERKEQLKKEFKEALEATAKEVGHEASTLQSDYLMLHIEENFLKDGTVPILVDKH